MLTAAVEQRVQHGQVTFEAAAQLTSLPAELLRKLVRDGVLSGDAPWRVSGLVGTCNLDEAQQIATKLITARNKAEGQGILATEAATKYGFSNQSIYSWLKNGHVRIIGTLSNGDWLINEGDVAFARAIADITGKTSYIFPAKGAGRPRKQ